MTVATLPVLVDVAAAVQPARARRRLRLPARVPDAGVIAGLAAFTVVGRLAAVMSSGGFRTTMGYNDGVYFAATNGLLHGLMPYRDFVLLHPPGIMLFGAGPVCLGHALGLSDSGTLVLVRVSLLGLGVLHTVLVFLAGRHLSRITGVVAACLYVWLPMVREERSILLEPVIALGVLTALALIPPVSQRANTGWWRPVLAGMIGGLALATKLWAIVPILVIAVGLLSVGRWRTVITYTAAGLATVTMLVGPFVAGSPSRMWHLLVFDQLGRPPEGDSHWLRLALMMDFDASPLTRLVAPNPPADLLTNGPLRATFFATAHAHQVLGAAAMAAVGIALAVATRQPVARIWVALLAVQAAVLMTVPTFFAGYASFTGPAAVLVIGAAAHLAWNATPARSRTGTRTVLAGLLVACIAVLASGKATVHMARRVNPKVAPLVADATCVASDDPIYLALTNTLSTNLANRCAPVVDFSGIVYTLAHPTTGPTHASALRRGSPGYQQFVTGYFATADHVILRRWHIDGLTARTFATLRHRPLLHPRVPLVYGPTHVSGPPTIGQ